METSVRASKLSHLCSTKRAHLHLLQQSLRKSALLAMGDSKVTPSEILESFAILLVT